MGINFRLLCALCLLIVLGAVGPGQAQDSEEPGKTEESPWLLVPMITSDPKLGNSLGLTGGYLHQFDPGSTPSMFLLHTSYSDTDSRISALFGQMFFDSDRQKLILGMVDGRIENDYEDFLGSGIPAQTTDNLDAVFARYYHVVSGDWYAGFQLVSSNYAIGAEGFLEDFLEFIGLTGFDSTGVGLAVEYDTRDNQRNPSTGKHFEASNLAYRESLGGDESFDVYRGEYSQYINFRKDHVLAWQVVGRWTDDAPIGGYSSIELRGYVRGNYLAPHYTHAQVEDRISFTERWGMSVFGGLACLYDSVSDCESSDNLYASVGAGVILTLKPEAGIVVRAEVAKGEADEATFYLKLGNSF